MCLSWSLASQGVGRDMISNFYVEKWVKKKKVFRSEIVMLPLTIEHYGVINMQVHLFRLSTQ